MVPMKSPLVASLSFVPALMSACAWRSGGVEHYVGPVSFRHVSPPQGKAYVSQVVRWGLSAEGGSSWGVSVGMSERIAVAPISSTGTEAATAIKLPRWSMPFGTVPRPTENAWHLSLLYLRVEDMPKPLFTSRTSCGVDAVIGEEASAFSIGYASRSRTMPPENAFSTLHFESSRPIEAQAKVWPDFSERSGLATDLVEETKR